MEKMEMMEPNTSVKSKRNQWSSSLGLETRRLRLILIANFWTGTSPTVKMTKSLVQTYKWNPFAAVAQIGRAYDS